jgi:ABC-2 type transport system ATP-binding protein
MGLAQALVQGAEVLLLDEPTAALDPDQKDAFAVLLNDLVADMTVVVSSHDVSDLAESYDRVIVLNDGRVRFDGSTSEFMQPAGRPVSAVEAYRAAL